MDAITRKLLAKISKQSAKYVDYALDNESERALLQMAQGLITDYGIAISADGLVCRINDCHGIDDVCSWFDEFVATNYADEN